MSAAQATSGARPDPFGEHGRTPPGYFARWARGGLVAGDVVPQPPVNPPLGELAGDELYELHQLDRVLDVHGPVAALGLTTVRRLGLGQAA